MKQTPLDLHIEELILRNLPYEQRYRIAEAFEQELTRLLTEHGLPPTLAAGGNIPHINLDHISVAAQAKPTAIGIQIAQQVYRVLHTLPGGEQTRNVMTQTEASPIPTDPVHVPTVSSKQ
jgi:hypothetical protein